MTIHTKDRDYYRALTNRELIDEAKNAINPDWQELTIALSEKLEAEEFNPANWTRCPRCGYED